MSYLELAKKVRKEYRKSKQQGGAEPETSAVDQIIDESVVAVLIDSEVLGGPIWFALHDGWRPDEADNVPIFYANELPALRMKTPEQLRSIFNVKRKFGGGRVRQ